MPRAEAGAHATVLSELRERAKELNCLYEVEEVLSQPELPRETALLRVAEILGPAFQYPELARGRVHLEGEDFLAAGYEPTPWCLEADIQVQGHGVGALSVCYLEAVPEAAVGPFLHEEARLLNSVATRLGHYLLYHRLKEAREDLVEGGGAVGGARSEWRAAILLLQQTDAALCVRLARKMLNHLCAIGIDEAQALLLEIETGGTGPEGGEAADGRDGNEPGPKPRAEISARLTEAPFELAGRYMDDAEILHHLQTWVMQDRVSFFYHVLANPRSSLPEIGEALRRFRAIIGDRPVLPLSTRLSHRASLTRRFLTEQLDFVKVAKDHLRASDFVALLDTLILPPNSHGRLGGKGAGLILAQRVLERTASPERPVGDFKVPRTWYLASDALLTFIAYNDLQEVIEQKYKEIDQVRSEYPNIVQLFRSSHFPADIERMLSVALEAMGDVPLIVRSSSLLEDRLGSAFSGKYKSLFLANQGSREDRLEALLGAITEVYASVFGPDPIAYRNERGLLEYHEEMGILIQEVVGRRVGPYFLPAFSGVAFSRNEFRWSPRIRREDGLLRLVPGLGTRAVDRVPDDYPILLAPGQPTLRVNVALEEVIRYSPRKVDLINLESRRFETVAVEDLARACGPDYPGLELVFSVLREDRLTPARRLLVDPEREAWVTTFAGLTQDTPFVQQLRNVLLILEAELGVPVDIEFAHDGQDFYLLQCRPQSGSDDDAPAPIPKDVPAADILFTARRFVSNGWVPDVTHLVYVDSARYAALGDRKTMLDVGRAVGQLNKLLPRRQFLLIGPGRWGSRGDVRLGVSVSYADIRNAAMLIEVARRQGDYLPDLSFGTHFFQDLVEARIRYLPLYPDSDGTVFNERFLRSSRNLLPEILPEFAALAEVLRVIDIPQVAGGRVLRVLMNAELDEAVALLAHPTEIGPATPASPGVVHAEPDYWHWRWQMAERIAASLDPGRFGVLAFYLLGSTKNATAGPGSDIDLLLHVRASEDQRRDLAAWLEGWSLCLAEMNYLRTGYRSPGLLDVHLVTDEDIARRSSFAVKIGAVTDPARQLPMGGAVTAQ